MNGHRLDIKHRRLEKPMANHFNSEGHSLEDLSICDRTDPQGGRELSQSERKLLDLDAPIAGPRGTEP